MRKQKKKTAELKREYDQALDGVLSANAVWEAAQETMYSAAMVLRAALNKRDRAYKALSDHLDAPVSDEARKLVEWYKRKLATRTEDVPIQ